ncbi:MAG: hypothetical protein AAF494_10950 [Pseudomonadota bacterium]
MKPILLSLSAAAAAMVLHAPAAACDLDGLPGLGFHRYNPFANAHRGAFPAETPLPAEPREERSAKADGTSRETASRRRSSDKKAASERQRRQRALEAVPVREWELDTGNGPISAEDKAIFT